MASGLEKDVGAIQDCLDLNKPIPTELTTDSGLLSAAEVLLRFLDCLPDSVIPRSMHDACLKVCDDLEAAQVLLEQLPAANKVLFDYLVSFLQHLLDRNMSFDKHDICYIFAPILIKTSSSDTKDHSELRNVALFLSQFL